MTTPFFMMTCVLTILSSLMAISSSNWIYVWASLELNLLAFIPIMLHSNANQESEAAIKYFLAQALGSSLMLMSSMSLWMETPLPSTLFSSVLLMSLILKLGAAPCHTWYPAVMSSISWMSCLILSTWQKLAPLFIISMMIQSPLQKTLMLLASLNALLGGAIGMNQSQLRSIMAYSSITHMGWMIALISINKPILSISYFTMYSTLIIPIFMTLHSLSSTYNMNMNNMMKSMKMKIMFPLLILSLGGLPPLTGFIPKWMTMMEMSSINPYLLLSLILGSMMNLYFYLNISFNMIISPNMNHSNLMTSPITSISPSLATLLLTLLPTIMIL